MMPKFYPRGFFPPESNTERQRRFRERNPGYYGRLHRKRKAELEAFRLKQLEQAAVVEEPAKPQLALPAPAVTFEFPGINALPTRESIERQRELVPVSRSEAGYNTPNT